MKIQLIWQAPTKIMGKFFQMGIGKQVVIGVIFGAFIGVLTRFVNIGIKPDQFKVLGDVFLDLVKMTVVPLIFSSISSAILSMDDMKKCGKVALQGMKLFIFTTAIAVIIGITSAHFIKPGFGTNIDTKSLSTSASVEKILNSTQAKSSIGDKMLNIIPDNIFQAMYNANLMQVIFFAVIFSVSIGMLEGKIHKGIVLFIHDLAKIMYSMVKIVMRFAPFGIFGLAVWIAGTQNATVLLALLKLVLTELFGISILVFVFYPLFLILRFRINPLPFIKKMIPVQMFALASCSSAATLPMNVKNAQENIGISHKSSNLLMPIGTGINMNGNGCGLPIYVIFIAQLFGIPLGISDYFSIGVLCLISAMGSPPVPGGGVIILAGILTALGYPLEILSLILGVDKMISPLRTLGNVTGDTFAPLYVDLANGTLDKDIYLKKINT